MLVMFAFHVDYTMNKWEYIIMSVVSLCLTIARFHVTYISVI